MTKETKLSVIEEIISWDEEEWIKLHFIQCYMLGWETEEQIHEVTRSFNKD